MSKVSKIDQIHLRAVMLCMSKMPKMGKEHTHTYVSLRLRVQNQRTKWNFPLNFRTMHKLSELYSGIFQTQSSGCVSGLDHFRNFTNLKILNI